MKSPEYQRGYDAGYAAGLNAAKAQQQDPLTMDRIREMSTDEVARRLPEVSDVLAGRSPQPVEVADE